MASLVHPDWIPLLDPPDAELERSEYADGLILRAETERLLALHHIHRARASLAFLADVLRATPGPEGDARADAWADRFGEECERVGKHIAGLREFRGCVGQG
jgi:hypothetical protein